MKKKKGKRWRERMKERRRESVWQNNSTKEGTQVDNKYSSETINVEINKIMINETRK